MKKQKDWKLQDIPNLKGKIIIITGANSGLGREATKILVKFGAHVIMATRDHEKATKAKEAILKENEEGSLEIMKIDLADLSSIRNFVKEFEGKYS